MLTKLIEGEIEAKNNLVVKMGGDVLPLSHKQVTNK